MTLGDQPAFPNYDGNKIQLGMTYRQALIKEIAPAVIGHVLGVPAAKLNGFSAHEACAKLTFDFADAIIKRLEEK